MASPVVSIETDEPSWLWNGLVPSLNGLRAVSIFIVILAHAFRQAQISEGYLPVAGATGVDVFFVISGFLITLLLLREQKRSGVISVPQFYLRRSLRIFPAFFTYLGIMSGLAAFGVIGLSTKELVAAATYTSNIFHWGTWDVGHTWSLCVEEHFYLLWGFALVLLTRFQAFRLAAAYVLLTPLLRVLLRLIFQYDITLWSFTLTRMDSIAVGCCLAFAATSSRLRPRMSLTPRQAVWLTASGSAFLVVNHILMHHYGLQSKIIRYYGEFMSGTVNALVIGAIVWSCVSYPGGVTGKVLNSKPLVFVGIISYSLYLWQQPFFNPQRSVWFCDFPANILVAAIIAVSSYYLIERPFLALKQWVAPG